MKRDFLIGKMKMVPDGTRLSPFLNLFDSNWNGQFSSGLPALSIAAGEILPGRSSKIHVHPVVSVVPWVVKGRLRIRMKRSTDPTPCLFELKAKQAAVTEPGAFQQLINPSRKQKVTVLYIATPAYRFVKESGELLYDDAISLEDSWDDLATRNWEVDELTALASTRKRRHQLLSKMRR